ncbi:MAG: flap endonuclease-1 [Candidatus Thermoplasmatota archaeon]|nr:flap endonuclease-1 [Candidatus Thermoplasmatota archaeon]
MGVDLGGIIPARTISLKDISGRTIAVDAYNTIYQFLSIIRQPDGTPLMDSKGRVTSHISGLIYRTSSLLEAGIKPVFVFDGKPHELKRSTIKERSDRKVEAEKDWKEALERGDVEAARSKAMQTSRLTKEMVEQAKTLLSAMGLPFVQAPSEGEAQASHMARKGDVYACASQDFDALLFGAPRLIRNLAITGRRKLPRKNTYVDIEPEIIELEETLSSLGVTRERLVDMGYLVGTDFNEGIYGIGPKKALKLVKEHPDLGSILKAISQPETGYAEIQEIFLKPNVTDEYSIVFGKPDRERIISIVCGEFEFSRERVGGAIEKLEKALAPKQKRLDFF